MKQLKIILTILLSLAILTTPIIAKDGKNKKKPVKQIAITFNELPAALGFKDTDREAITYLILQALKKHEVKATGFVIGEQIENSFDILGRWLNDGHKLGNMSHTNQDLNQISIAAFVEDISKGDAALETMLNGFGQKGRYFRYPFLHYGNSSEKKEEVSLYLDTHRYKIGHATVLVEDYLYNLSLSKMGGEPDSARFEALLNEYINHVLDQIEAAEQSAMTNLGRPVKHVLQLSANRLNAVYLDEMLGAIKKELGYEIITLDKALGDDLYRKQEAYFGTRGVGYIDMIMKSDADFLPAE